jgi:uncharacterized protein (TIGR00255 family)
MRSMTGFGEGVAESGRLRVRVRIRSVNHRFLDLNLRLPEEQWGLEPVIEAVLRRRLERGRVEVRVSIESVGVRLQVRRGALADLQRQLAELAGEEREAPRTGLGALLGLPGIVVMSSREDDPQQTGELLRSATAAALDRLVEAREREGERLAEALEERRQGLIGRVGEIGQRWEELRAKAAPELAARVADLLGGGAVSEERIVQEAAMLVERMDIGEELDRLAAHLDQLAAPGGAGRGKRLEFLSQEVLRELNTIGSKCRDPQVVAWVVEAKLLCEQLREQAQNVE